MDEIEVESRDALAVAVLNAAQPTFEAAKQNPVSIRLVGTNTVYTFREGVTERRAAQIARLIRRTPRAAFKPTL